jgi:hypothetical protein
MAGPSSDGSVRLYSDITRQVIQPATDERKANPHSVRLGNTLHQCTK